MSPHRYEQYVDSHDPRLGRTPAHWPVVMLKRIATLVYGEALPHERRNEEGTVPVYGSNGAFGMHDEQNTGAPVIFIGRKGSCGALRWSERPGFAIDTVYFIDEANSVADLRWLYWGLSILGLESASQDTGVPGLSREVAYEARLPLPTKAEQRAIAAFLDRETAKIDALVTEQERLIALLAEKRRAVISHAVTKGLDPNAPMKDSGIEWLGEVPAHWDVRRLGTLFKEVADEGFDGLPILSVSIHDGVSDRELNDEELDRKVTRSDDLSKYRRVEPGDLVYNMMRAWQGGFGTVKVAGMVSPAYVIARPLTDLNASFVEHVLRTPCAIEEMRRNSKGVTDFRLRLYWDEFKHIEVAVPPAMEQSLIERFLCQRTSTLDALTTEAERAIALLKERRAALISAAVTGKIDVRETVEVEEAAA